MAMETPPERVGKYEVLGLVGRGAIGVVYKARDPFMNRTVALKKFAGRDLLEGGQGDALKTRFLHEAKTAGRLKHTHIVTIFDVDVDPADGLPFMAMEYAEGGSLAAWMRTHGAMPLEPAVGLIQQVAAGLAYGHDHGVVHRDVKPDNILLDAEARPLIADFGCAHIQDPELTVAAFTALGTPFYMSPEQVRAEPVDGRSDLFSLGVVLYLLVTGNRPFKGDSVPSVCYSIVNNPPEPLPPDLPHSDALRPVLARLLAKRREDRFASGQELVSALEALRRSLGEPPPAPASASCSPGRLAARRAARALRSLLSGLASVAQTLIGVALFCFILVLVLAPEVLVVNRLWPERLERAWSAAKAGVETGLSSWRAGRPFEGAAEPATSDASEGDGAARAGPSPGAGGAKRLTAPAELTKGAGDAVALARQRRFQEAFRRLDEAEAGLAALTPRAGAPPRPDLEAARAAVSDARRQVIKALAAWAGPILDEAASCLARLGSDGAGGTEAVVQAYAKAYPVVQLDGRLPHDLARRAQALRADYRRRLSGPDWARAQELGKAQPVP